MATRTTEIAFPPLDSQATQTFIDQNVAASAQSGDITTDFKKALIARLGLEDSNYALDDLWKRYQLSTTVTGDSEAVGPVKRSPPEHAGQHPKHFLPPSRLRNPGNAKGFPNAPTWDGTLAQLNQNFNNRGLYGVYSRYIQSGPLWNADGSNYYMCIYSGTSAIRRQATAMATTNEYYLGQFETVESVDTVLNPASVLVDMVWNSDGTALICAARGTNRFETYNLTGTPYSPGLSQDNTADAVSATFNTARDIPICLDISPDGTKIFYVSEDTARLVVYGELTTPWDVSTWTELGTVDTAVALDKLRFGPDGENVYGLGDATDIVYRYSLSTPYDLSTMSVTADESWDSALLWPSSQQQVSDLRMMPTASGFEGIQLIGYDTSTNQSYLQQFVFRDTTSGQIAAVDPTKVVLQLVFEGAPAVGVSNTFVDRSTYSQPIELYEASCTTLASGGPFASGRYLDTTTNGGVQFTDDGTFVFGAEPNWSIEAMIKQTSKATPGNIFGHEPTQGMLIYHGRGSVTENAAVFGLAYREGGVLINSYYPNMWNIIELNTWYHMVIQRTGNTLDWYVDGVKVHTYDCTGLDMDEINAGEDWVVGNGTTLIDLHNVRVIKGQSIYSGSGFTPPTTEYDDP